VSKRPRPGRLVLLGHPVAHSLSPLFQQAALDALGIPLRYEALDVPPADLASVLDALRRDGAAGNVTVPHKEAVAAACVRSATAERTGAVNVFRVNADGELEGENTDVLGFVRAVEALLPSTEPLREQRVVVLGGGGAAAAVCEAAGSWPGSEVLIVARTRTRAERLAARWPALVRVADSVVEAVESLAGRVSLVVNATPVGLSGDTLPLNPRELPGGCAVLDLTYRRGTTPLVAAALRAGLPASDGRRMLVEQGAAAFEYWFGVPAPRDVMWRALEGL
jgi:shikimate dehydrogenase